MIISIADRWNPNGNVSSGGLSVISPTMMATKDINEKIKIGATGKGISRGHRQIKERGGVVVIAREIREEMVWGFTSG